MSTKNAQSESSLHRSATGRGAWEDPAGEEQGAGVQSQTAASCHRRPGPGDRGEGGHDEQW